MAVPRLMRQVRPCRNLPRQPLRSRFQRRFESSETKSSQPKASETKFAEAEVSEARTRSRADKIIGRLPGFLRKYTTGLKNAPVTHVVSFLVLHEITAVVPLIGLTALFHYTHWLPSVISESKYIADGIEMFGRYFRRKGWFGFNNEDGPGKREKVWNVSEGASRFLVEVATAYAITKAMLPARLVLSVWGTPWFARVVIGRLGGAVRKVFGRKKVAGSAVAPAAGTGASGKGQSAVVKGAPSEKP